jgi:hypothetical protein
MTWQEMMPDRLSCVMGFVHASISHSIEGVENLPGFCRMKQPQGLFLVPSFSIAYELLFFTFIMLLQLACML